MLTSQWQLSKQCTLYWKRKREERKKKPVTFLLLVHTENRVEIVVKIEVSGRFAIDFDRASLHLRYLLFSDRPIWLPPISCPAFFMYLFIYL